MDEVGLQRREGIFGWHELEVLGITRQLLRSNLDGRRWQRVFPRVYAAFTGTLTRSQLFRAALQYGWPHAVLGYYSAAESIGLRAPNDDVVHLVVAYPRQMDHDPRVLVHRSRFLPEHHLCDVAQGRATHAARTALDLAPHLRPWTLRDLVAYGLRQGRLDATAALLACESLPRHRGSRLLSSVVRRAEGAHTGAEVRLADAARLGGFPGKPNGSIVTGDGIERSGDLVREEEQVVWQAEGGVHSLTLNTADDMQRDQDWIAAGYLPVRMPNRTIEGPMLALIRSMYGVLCVRRAQLRLPPLPEPDWQRIAKTKRVV